MKRQSKKFESPLRPWDRTRIDKERAIKTDYGLRRKHEIWRAESILRNFRRLARGLAAKRDKKQETILLEKVYKLGLISKNATLDDVLALELESILNRRLQTIVMKKGLATTPNQARQFIVHGHIAVDGRRVRWPSILIDTEKEGKVHFYERSPIKIAKSGVNATTTKETA
jgi:small subunit ribosomal protein S4